MFLSEERGEMRRVLASTFSPKIDVVRRRFSRLLSPSKSPRLRTNYAVCCYKKSSCWSPYSVYVLCAAFLVTEQGGDRFISDGLNGCCCCRNENSGVAGVLRGVSQKAQTIISPASDELQPAELKCKARRFDCVRSNLDLLSELRCCKIQARRGLS